jgi:hypothetical protein
MLGSISKVNISVPIDIVQTILVSLNLSARPHNQKFARVKYLFNSTISRWLLTRKELHITRALTQLYGPEKYLACLLPAKGPP